MIFSVHFQGRKILVFEKFEDDAVMIRAKKELFHASTLYYIAILFNESFYGLIFFLTKERFFLLKVRRVKKANKVFHLRN